MPSMVAAATWSELPLGGKGFGFRESGVGFRVRVLGAGFRV